MTCPTWSSLYLFPFPTSTSIHIFSHKKPFVRALQFWIENQEGCWFQNFVFDTVDRWQTQHSGFSLCTVSQLWVAGCFLHLPNQCSFLQGSELTQFSLKVTSCLVDLLATHRSLFTKDPQLDPNLVLNSRPVFRQYLSTLLLDCLWLLCLK